jgi:unsaturated rhamnogalacturonyl hydrolase
LRSEPLRIISRGQRQFLVHIKYLFDRQTGLWYHGWTFDGRHNFAGALWARGNCWVIAIPEIIEMLDLAEGDAFRTFLIDTLAAQVKTLAEHQDEAGCGTR